MTTALKVNRPQPIITDKPLEHFHINSNIDLTIKVLESGQPILITELYSNGLLLMKEIQQYLKVKFPGESFQKQREYRSAYQKLSNLVLIEVVGHQLKVKKAPSIGWLTNLYADTSSFLLSFPQIQGLNSSWQWYQNGISIPVLRNKLHPYYGTYFPTRFDHLILFDNWLKRYEGPKKTAMEVGVGSGVLSFQLIKHGFQKVFATDTNPNAIVGLQEFMGETKLSRKVELDFGKLFGRWENKTELIVFNPPWLPESKDTEGNEDAIYYNEGLFPEFFAAAKKRLLPEGKLLLVFSNLAEITGLTKDHPIEKELAKGDRFKLEKCFNRKVKAASSKTKRDQSWRSTEEVEMWILTHK
jgi:hypothetical protein